MRQGSKLQSKVWSRSRALGRGLVACFLGYWGCANQAECDPGFELAGSRCVPVAPATPEDAAGMGGAGGATDSP
jgi:hypothetical protein